MRGGRWAPLGGEDPSVMGPNRRRTGKLVDCRSELFATAGVWRRSRSLLTVGLGDRRYPSRQLLPE